MAKQKWRLKRRNFLAPARKKWATRQAAAFAKKALKPKFIDLTTCFLTLKNASRCDEFVRDVTVSRILRSNRESAWHRALTRRILRREEIDSGMAEESIVHMTESSIRTLLNIPDGDLPERIPVPLDIEHADIQRVMSFDRETPARFFLYPRGPNG